MREKNGYSVQGENLSLYVFVKGELAFMLGELFVSPEFALCFALLRTMCGSRTCGWSLPGVMSD
jgi:hypothetical protein